MFLVSGPYLSKFLVETIIRNRWPVLNMGKSPGLGLEDYQGFVSDKDARSVLQGARPERVLTNSEDSFSWVYENLSGTQIARFVDLFKDKAELRRRLNPLYPDLFFREVDTNELQSLASTDLPLPVVVKPNRGFLSIGVHTVAVDSEWQQAKSVICDDLRKVENSFSEQVIGRNQFLIESYIDGEEYAVDAYFDSNGAPVILNILEHRFSKASSVSDRLYVSSKNIIEQHRERFEKALCTIGSLEEIRNFPVHAEFRVDASGNAIPIEINPLRFGGWCTTGDFAHHAWGFNSYELFMQGERPDWNLVLRDRDGKLYSIVVLDNSTGLTGQQIDSFDYDRLRERFSKPLLLSRLDFRTYPLFGFLFLETLQENADELDWVLQSNLREFVDRKILR